MSTCWQCGARSTIECADLFERLLVLDYSLERPWGPVHGVVVACYRLQHSELSAGDREVLLDLIGRYAQGGQEALHRWVAGVRRANSHRGGDTARARTPAVGTCPGAGETQADMVPAPLTGEAHQTSYAVTIADVAVDGTFPAEGHQERVADWVRATLAAWQD